MRLLARLSFILYVLCFFALPGRALDFTVTTQFDTGAAGSLRWAIASATGAAGDDTITFNIPGCATTACNIHLTLGEIVINGIGAGSVTITNPTGADKLAILGTGSKRLFFIDNGIRVVMSGVTLSAGAGRGDYQPPLNGRGGAIHIGGGELELNDSVVSDSFSPTNVGAENVKGGGIYIGGSGRAVLNRTLVTRNKSAAGAGIFNEGILMVNNSTLSRNEGITDSANNINSSTGGGILSQGGLSQTFITNSTVSGNTATLVGGIEPREFAPFVITNTTIAFNVATGSANGVGGITTSLAGTPLIKMRNTIVSDNVASGFNALPNMFGKYASGGRNLIGFIDPATVSGFTANDFVNSSSVFLGQLSSNGGLTPTIVPAANSAAINAGDNCVRTQLCPDFNAPVTLFTDQRGVSRFSYGQVDIGAVERQFVTITNATNLPNGRQNQPYGESLFASGGTAPYTFTVTDGALPGGVTLRPDGYLNGTPTASGTFNFTVQVTDSSTGSGFADPGRFLDSLAPEAIVTNKAFQLQILAPTAATVSVGGRVLTASGRGVFGAIVTMTDSNGNVRYARANPHGVYRFHDVVAGETYVFNASFKRYSFSPPTQIRSIVEETADINFMAETGGIIQ